MIDPISYADAPIAVRGDFAAAHNRFWMRLAGPGAWWNGAQRIAIAREVRAAGRCALCAERKAALTPNIPGDHDRATELNDATVEAIHRVASDPGRLTRSWYATLLEDGLTPEQYIEIVGTLVAIVSIDSFCRGIGVPPNELPDPLPGDPSGYRPTAAAMEDAWVPMIPADGNDGSEADLWPTGRTGNVIRALSLVPDECRTLADLSAAHYLPHAQVGIPEAHPEHLDRLQTELIAGRVSALNQCFY